MTRARRPDDWGHDLAAARPSEARVREALIAHPHVSHVSDFTAEYDALDFQFRLDGHDVRLEVKAKLQPHTSEYLDLWPDVPPADLFIIDEISYRRVVWGEGMGFVLVDDQPARRWHVLGPWELCLGPRRRFARRGDRGSGEFPKGKLLLDLRTAAATTPDLSIAVLVKVVRSSRRDLERVQAVRIRTRHDLPLVPRELEVAAAQVAASPVDPGPAAAPAREVDFDPAWCGLGPALVDGITRHLGWDAPTEVQRLAFPPILGGENVLLLAPTAGGKTEAALLPLLDRLGDGGGRAPTILAVSPLKALLDDQVGRYRDVAGLVGATAFAWHGDVDWEDKRHFLDEPSTILLTTPESLEVLLASPTRDHVRLFTALEAVIVDEVHAFVGTARGAQLASLVERIDRFAEADLQRVGLSATVGNPEEVLAWLRGGSLRDHRVVRAEAKIRGEQVRVQSFVDLPGALETIGAIAASATALVFTRSRRRAEELGSGLGVPVHHSSLSARTREETLAQLASGAARCIVATSGLEMGVDIAEVDLVVHDGAPTGPASYLQRLGRAGRRTGLRRLVFTTGEPDDLLLILGVLARVRRDDLETLPPRRGARLVLGQQVLTLAMERTVVRRRELADALRWSAAFSASAADIETTIEHLVAGGWLVVVEDKLVAGAAAHARFAGRRLADLAVTFDIRTGARVVDQGGAHLGQLDWAQVEEEGPAGRDRSLVLGGRAWQVLSVDRTAGTVVVRPGTKGKPVSWRGPMLEVDRLTWQAVREVLVDTDVPVAMDPRTQGWLTAARARWRPRLQEPVRFADGAVTVDSFAGAAVHRAVLAALAVDGEAEGATCTLRASLEEAVRRARSALARFDDVVDDESARVAPTLPIRNPELVPPALLLGEAREFHVDAEGIGAVLRLLAAAG